MRLTKKKKKSKIIFLKLYLNKLITASSILSAFATISGSFENFI